MNLSGQPVDGSADLHFSLFDAASAGNAVAPTQTVLNANVVDGLFPTQLDFGVDAFAGSSRWIEIAVRSPAGSGTPGRGLCSRTAELKWPGGPGDSADEREV